jgi:alpha-tubulin suppressor-like RCC1 family protein
MLSYRRSWIGRVSNGQRNRLLALLCIFTVLFSTLSPLGVEKSQAASGFTNSSFIINPTSNTPIDLLSRDDANPVDVKYVARNPCVLFDDGLVYCQNSNNQFLDVGLENVVEIENTDYTICAVLENGDAYCWGSAEYGALGSGDKTTAAASPQKALLDGISTIDAFASGFCAQTVELKIFCWGSSLGAYDVSPVEYSTLEGASAFAIYTNGIICAVVQGQGRCSNMGHTFDADLIDNADQLVSGTTWYEELCAIFGRQVRCFGQGEFGHQGAMHSGTFYPWSAPDSTKKTFSFDSDVLNLEVSDYSVCARTGTLSKSELSCWGKSPYFSLEPKIIPTPDRVAYNSTRFIVAETGWKPVFWAGTLRAYIAQGELGTRTTSRISGTLKTEDGQAIAGGTLSYRLMGTVISSVTTGADGSFVINGKTGPAELTISNARLNGLAIGNVPWEETPLPLDVVDRTQNATLVVSNQPATVSRKIRVETGDGIALPGATLTFNLSPQSVATVAKQAGNYSVRWSAYGMTATANEYGVATVRVPVGMSGTVTAASSWANSTATERLTSDTLLQFNSIPWVEPVGEQPTAVARGSEVRLTFKANTEWLSTNPTPTVNSVMTLSRVGGSSAAIGCTEVLTGETDSQGEVTFKVCPSRNTKYVASVGGHITSIPISVNVILGTPTIPLNVTTSQSLKKITMSWEAPTDDGGGDLTYEVERSVDGSEWAQVANSESRSYLDSSLELGNVVTYRVRSANTAHSGTWVETEPMLIAVVPSEVKDVLVMTENSLLVARWSAPEDDGGAPITEYSVEISDDGTDWQPVTTVNGSTFEALINSGLAKKFKIRVSAKNVAGFGPAGTSDFAAGSWLGANPRNLRTTLWGNYDSTVSGWMTRTYMPQAAIAGNQVHSRNNRFCYLDTQGDTYCYGSNWRGTLGFEGNLDQMVGPASAVKIDVPKAIDLVIGGHDAIYGHTCVLTEGKEVYCWGRDVAGEVSGARSVGSLTWDENFSVVSSPVQVDGIPSDAVKLFSGGWSTCVLTSSEKLYCWGGLDQTGSWSQTGAKLQTGLPSGIRDVIQTRESVCVLTGVGTLYCRGREIFTNPLSARFNNSWTKISVGFRIQSFATTAAGSCVVNLSGELYCVGANSAGFGHKTKTAYDTLTKVALPEPVFDVAATDASFCAASRTNVYCFGDGRTLGNGIWSAVKLPVAVPDFFPRITETSGINKAARTISIEDLQGSVDGFKVVTSMDVAARSAQTITGRVVTAAGVVVDGGSLSWSAFAASSNGTSSSIRSDGTFSIRAQSGLASLTFNGVSIGAATTSFTKTIDSDSGDLGDIVIADPPATARFQARVESQNGFVVANNLVRYAAVDGQSVVRTFDGQSYVWSNQSQDITSKIGSSQLVEVFAGESVQVYARVADGNGNNFWNSPTYYSVPKSLSAEGSQQVTVSTTYLLGHIVLSGLSVRADYGEKVTVSGVVYDLNGEPLANTAGISLSRLSGSGLTGICSADASVSTNALGEFSIQYCAATDGEVAVTVPSSYSVGASEVVSVRVDPVVAGVPGNVSVGLLNGVPQLSWVEPANNGGTSFSYDVEKKTGEGSWVTVSNQASVSLADGAANLGETVSYRVRTTNSKGSSAWVVTEPLLVAVVPTAPRDVAVTNDGSKLVVTWKAPTNDGGAPVTEYVVEISDDGTDWIYVGEAEGDVYRLLIDPLSAGHLGVRVVARNSAGYSNPGASENYSISSDGHLAKYPRNVFWGTLLPQSGWSLTPNISATSNPENKTVARHNRVCYLDSVGDTYCYGNNWRGTLGSDEKLNEQVSSQAPIHVNVPEAVDIVAGGHDLNYSHTCVLTKLKEVYCWGRDIAGEVSGKRVSGSMTWDENYSVVSTPVKVDGVPSDAVKLYSGGWSTCVLTASEKLYCWGGLENGGSWGNLGAQLQSSLPIGIKDVYQTRETICAITGAGILYCRGQDLLSGGYFSTWHKVSLGFRVQSFATSTSGVCVVDALGDLYCKGANSSGFGHRTLTVYGELTKIVLPESVKSVATTGNTFCAASDKAVYCMGDGRSLGNGTWTASFLPVKVTTLNSALDPTVLANNELKNLKISRLEGSVDGFKLTTDMELKERKLQQITGRLLTNAGTFAKTGTITWNAPNASANGATATIQSDGTFRMNAQSGRATLSFNSISIDGATTSFSLEINSDSGELGDIVIADPQLTEVEVKLKSLNGVPIPVSNLNWLNGNNYSNSYAFEGRSYSWSINIDAGMIRAGKPVKYFSNESFSLGAYTNAGWANGSVQTKPGELNELVLKNSQRVGYVVLDQEKVSVDREANVIVSGTVFGSDDQPLPLTEASLVVSDGAEVDGLCPATLKAMTDVRGKFRLKLCGAHTGKISIEAASNNVMPSEPMIFDVAAVSPTAPRSVIVAQRNAALQVNWKKPRSDGGEYPTYDIERRIDSGEWGRVATGVTEATWLDSDVLVGEKYQYRLTAVNEGGRSKASAASILTLASVKPSAPVVEVARGAAGRVEVSWSFTRGVNEVAPSGFKLQAFSGNSWIDVPGTYPTSGREGAYWDVAAGQSYRMRVIALSSAGDSDPSNVSDEVTASEFTPQAATVKIKVILASGAPVPNVSVSWKKPESDGRWIGGSQTNANGEVGQLAETGPGVIRLSNIRIPGAVSYDTVDVSVKPSQGDSTLTVVLPNTPSRTTSDVMLKTVDGVPVPGASIQRNGDNRVCLAQQQSGGTNLNVCYYDLLGQNSATTDASGRAEFSMWEGVNPGLVSGTFTSVGTSQALYSQTSPLYSDGRETQLAISFVSSVALEATSTRTNYGESADVVAYALKRDKTPYAGTTLSLRPVDLQFAPGEICPGVTEKLSAVTDAEGRATFRICRLSDTQFQATGDAALVQEAVLPSRVATFITVPLTPLEPSSLQTSLIPAGVQVTWAKSSSGRGAVIESQVIERSVDGGEWEELTSVDGQVSTWTDPEILIGRSMSYRVFAVNSVGKSAASNISSITGAKIFGPPEGVEVSISSPGKVRVAYGFTIVGALASTVDVSCRNSSDGEWESVRKVAPISGFLITDSPCFGESVEFRIRLNNAVGIGEWSAVTEPMLVYPQPEKPSAVSVAAIDASSISLNWVSAPAYTGLIFVGAELHGTIDGLDEPVSVVVDAAGTNSGAIFGGFERGVRVAPKIRFIYALKNGGAVMSDFVSMPEFIPSVAPVTAPRNVSVSQISQTGARVDWAIPADNGGVDVTGYQASAYDEQGELVSSSTTTANSINLTGLDANKTYSFTVAAINDRGVGLSSSATEFTTLIGAPSKVRNIAAVATNGNTSYELSWDAPAANGGSAILEYLVKWSSDDGRTWSAEYSAATETSILLDSIPAGRGLVFQIWSRNVNLSSLPEQLNQPVAPATPLISASALPGGLTANWVKPISTSSAVNGYEIQVSFNGGLDHTSYETNANSTTWDLPFVSIGQEISLRIAANNSIGTSEFSDWLTATSGELQVSADSLSGTGVVGTSRSGFILLDWDPVLGASKLIKKITATASVWNQAGDLLRQRQVDQPQTGITIGQLPTGEPVSVIVKLCGYTETNVEFCGEEVALVEQLTPVTWPSAPTNIEADQTLISSGEVTVDWDAPTDDGGAEIEEYQVDLIDQTPSAAFKIAGVPIRAAAVTTGVRVSGETTQAKLTGLQPGKRYRVVVKAKNSEVSTYSDPIALDVTTPSVDPAPTGLKLVSAATKNVSIKWNAYSGASSFRITCIATGKDPITKLVSTNKDDLLSGFAVNTNYSCTVAAGLENRFTAESLAVTVKVVATVPSKPTAPKVRATDGAVTVSWNEPATNNSPIEGYVVTSNVVGIGCVVGDSSTRTCQIAGLKNGTSYTFQLTARNAVGTSPASAKSVAVKPAGLPIAPTNLVGVSASKANTLTWTGANGNGAVITKFEYRSKLSTSNSWPTVWTSNSTKTSAKAKNWIFRSTYDVQIRVTSSAGSSISRIFSITQTK